MSLLCLSFQSLFLNTLSLCFTGSRFNLPELNASPLNSLPTPPPAPEARVPFPSPDLLCLSTAWRILCSSLKPSRLVGSIAGCAAPVPYFSGTPCAVLSSFYFSIFPKFVLNASNGLGPLLGHEQFFGCASPIALSSWTLCSAWASVRAGPPLPQ